MFKYNKIPPLTGKGKLIWKPYKEYMEFSFPDPKMLKEWEKFQEEAKNRDHRKIGRVSADK
ncbi:unnamed protein product [Ranitomeya imitator]|uniref:Uncharacterized protein n=1 Tax=Ranitomeya imitator TaxID=111125 RepID=A0ABN9LWI4_9NEOB|nr:unnamed protein product [Ranitomeya imitator]